MPNNGGSTRDNASIQAYFPATPSPTKSSTAPAPIGDGFTHDEIEDALKPRPAEHWCPPGEYAEVEIADLQPGPKAVMFMGRVANLFDVRGSPKSPRSATGCVKVCVRDGVGAVTVRACPACWVGWDGWGEVMAADLCVSQVRFWYAERLPSLRLGGLVTVWTTHGEFPVVDALGAGDAG